MSTNLFFILGAVDPEMRAIAEILIAQNLRFGVAGRSGRRVRREDAYFPEELLLNKKSFLTTRDEIVLIETDLPKKMNLDNNTRRLDHHNPGDPGFDANPRDYLKGSSLGQLLSFLSIDPTEDHMYLAAADHCLSAAYAGLCPNVDPDELLYRRASWRSVVTGQDFQAIIQNIESAKIAILKKFEENGSEAFFDDPFCIPSDLGEASALLGIPIRYCEFTRSGDIKECLKGASPESIRCFMRTREERGFQVYGNPYRGYAGAYHFMCDETKLARYPV